VAKPDPRLICLGIISSAHGVRGQVKIRSFTSSPQDITAYGALQDASGRTYHLTITGSAKNALIASIKGIDSREAAGALRNVELFVERSALPAPQKNEYYQLDLIGLEVTTEDNTAFGHIIGVHNFGAGDLVEIKLPTGKEEFLPLNKATFPVIDIKNKKVVIAPPEFI
jgi:16S rRNA processing protein RimM